MELLKAAFWNTKFAKIQALGIIVVFTFMAIYVPNFTGSKYTPLFIAWIMSYVVLTISWNFFSGKTGYISLATASFYGLGMYVQAVYGRQIPFEAVVLLSAVIAFIVGYGLGIVTLRLRGIYFTIFTFGLTLFLNKFLRWYEGQVTRTTGRTVKPYANEKIFLAVLIVFFITFIAIIIMNKSRFGLSLKCIGQNEDGAQHIGVKTTRTKALAFALTAAPCGAIGAIMSTAIGYIDPDIAFKTTASFFPVLMAIFGGMSTTYGPLFGAAVFYILQDYLMKQTSYYMIIFGAIMILIVLLMPKGVFGTIESIAAKRRRDYEREKVTINA